MEHLQSVFSAQILLLGLHYHCHSSLPSSEVNSNIIPILHRENRETKAWEDYIISLRLHKLVNGTKV